MSTLSIIIPTLNEEHYIKQLLQSIVKQTVAPKEVILVDGGSTDATLKIVKTFKKHLPLKIMEWSRGAGMQRNAGAHTATGDILLFLDADTELDPTFIQNACHEFTARKLDVAHASFYVDPATTPLDRLGGWLISNYGKVFQFSKKPMCNGCCVLSTQQMFKKLDGFNEAFLHSEDHDYALRAVHSGGRFRILKTSRFKVSNRRYVEQGRLNVLLIYIKAEINRIFFRYRFAPREEPIYNFGIFTRKQ